MDRLREENEEVKKDARLLQYHRITILWHSFQFQCHTVHPTLQITIKAREANFLPAVRITITITYTFCTAQTLGDPHTHTHETARDRENGMAKIAIRIVWRFSRL